MASTYLVAFFAASFAVCSLLTWIHAVGHIDPPTAAERPAQDGAEIAA